MVFSSVIFLFFFLPLTIFFYSCSGRRYQNGVLLCASLVFYAWGEAIYLLVMLASIVLNYLFGLLMLRKNGQPSVKILACGVSANLAILGFFKYANFLIDNLNSLLNAANIPPLYLSPVHLPIGISFFSFQAISYIVDIYRRDVEPQRNPINLGLYIALFPQLIAGPIVRYNTIARELTERSFKLAACAYGIRRFIFGLSKKVLLANPLAEVADRIFALPAAELSPTLAWLGALCYMLQIYFDFSGYSDMAIGLGRMFGFHFLENFNYPYISKSIREFWRRWHISLSSWLRDYLYIPLGGNRQGLPRTYFNLFIIFLLCGLWHGAGWTFICWGLFHGFFLVLERTRLGSWMQKWWWPLRQVWTLAIVLVGWVIFRCDTIGQATQYLTVMAGLSGAENTNISVFLMQAGKVKVELAAAILLCFPVYETARKGYLMMQQKCVKSVAFYLDSAVHAGHLMLIMVLGYYSVISMAAGVYNPFIYFRF